MPTWALYLLSAGWLAISLLMASAESALLCVLISVIWLIYADSKE